MGRGYTEYAFPDSKAKNEFALYSAFVDYEMPDGSKLHLRQSECWCPKCDRITMAEDIPSLTELEVELNRFLNPSADDLQTFQFLGLSIEEQTEEARKRIEWRLARKSPGKCLCCGSTEIVTLPEVEVFQHPNTGELVVVVGRGFADAGVWRATFTTEGDVIKSSEM
jgi:hypothetical protein